MLVRRPQNAIDTHNVIEHEGHAAKISCTNSDYENQLVFYDHGRTILNETIEPHEITSNDAFDLTDLDEASLHLRPIDLKFSKVLPKLHAITENYANEPLVDAFNWDKVARELDVD